jgi:hypothetical protein
VKAQHKDFVIYWSGESINNCLYAAVGEVNVSTIGFDSFWLGEVILINNCLYTASDKVKVSTIGFDSYW